MKRKTRVEWWIMNGADTCTGCFQYLDMARNVLDILIEDNPGHYLAKVTIQPVPVKPKTKGRK